MKLNKFIILSLATVLVLSLFEGCRKIGDETSYLNSSDVSSTVYDIVDVIEDDNQSADSTASSEDQESSATYSGSDNGSSSLPDNFVDVNDGDSEDDDVPPIYIEPEPEDSTSGDSSSDTIPTYIASLSSKGKTKTREIDPGKSHYYKIKGASNRILTIESPNAYVIYNGVTYSAKNGVVSFLVVSDELASAQILFEIGNNGSQKESFTIQFTSQVGSKDNPEVLSTVGENVSVKIEAGNDQGYSYSYAATKDGKIRFYILSDTTKGKITVDKIIDAKLQVVQQRSTDDTGEEYLKTDNTGTYIEFDVKSGDQFTITAGSNANGTDFPELTIVWKAIYA